MSFRIQTNVESLNAYRNLTITKRAQSRSMERLSSGFRINRAADDAAGLSISEKMRGQIRGLNQAVRNAQDAISLIQTAEGALNESHEILQRMRELAVQSATDTHTAEDRMDIQAEVDQLAGELSRIADTTEFNTQNLLDGTLDNIFHIGANEAQNIGLEIDAMDADALGVAGLGAGASYAITGTDGTGEDVADSTALVEGEQELQVVDFGEYKFVCEEGWYRYGLQNEDGDIVAVGGKKDGTVQTFDMLVEGVAFEDLETEAVADTDYSITFDDMLAPGSTVTLEVDGHDISTIEATAFVSATGIDTGEYRVMDDVSDLEYTDGWDETEFIGSIDLALVNEDDEVVAVTEDQINWYLIADLDPEDATGVDDQAIAEELDPAMVTQYALEDGDEVTITGADTGIDVSTQTAADRAITTIQEAIEQVSAERSKLGALQNRLEHTVANLEVAAENLTAAESRIRDVDMAHEMTEFTKSQILEEAGTAMLAQANMAPQSVLQLLG